MMKLAKTIFIIVIISLFAAESGLAASLQGPTFTKDSFGAPKKRRGRSGQKRGGGGVSGRKTGRVTSGRKGRTKRSALSSSSGTGSYLYKEGNLCSFYTISELDPNTQYCAVYTYKPEKPEEQKQAE